jgi:hypothetical protein
MSLSKKSKTYFKSWYDDRTPYRSWKQYRNSQNRVGKDSITNHLPLEGITMATYKFVCYRDTTKSIEMKVPDSLDMSKYIDTMAKSGYWVEGPNPDLIHTAVGSFVIEPKEWSETIECGYCGGVLDLISIEEGYSCRNEDCLCHCNV